MATRDDVISRMQEILNQGQEEASFITKKDCSATFDAALLAIAETVTKSEDTLRTKIGSFKVAERKARNGVNPRTGESLKIQGSKQLAFKANSAYTQKV